MLGRRGERGGRGKEEMPRKSDSVFAAGGGLRSRCSLIAIAYAQWLRNPASGAG